MAGRARSRMHDSRSTQVNRCIADAVAGGTRHGRHGTTPHRTGWKLVCRPVAQRGTPSLPIPTSSSWGLDLA